LKSINTYLEMEENWNCNSRNKQNGSEKNLYFTKTDVAEEAALKWSLACRHFNVFHFDFCGICSVSPTTTEPRNKLTLVSVNS